MSKAFENTKDKKIARDERSFSNATDGRLRAINRAPEAIREMYRQGLVSQVSP